MWPEELGSLLAVLVSVPPAGLYGDAPAGASQQEGADKGIEIAVEDAVDIAHLEFGAMVLHQAVRLQGVRANLAAETDFQLGLVELPRGLLPLLDFRFIQPRSQELHSQFAVFVLAALRLTLDYDARRQMCKAHGRLDFVDVLSAVTSCPKRINLEVLRSDVDLDPIVDFWDNKDRCKRGMAAGRLVEGRNADEPMHASFGRKQTVGVFALDAYRCGFDPGAFAGLGVDHRRAKTFALTPAQIHAQQHFRPILRFGATCAWLYGENCVEAIAFAREQRLGLELRDVLFGSMELLLEIAQDRLTLQDIALFFCQMKIGLDVA